MGGFLYLHQNSHHHPANNNLVILYLPGNEDGTDRVFRNVGIYNSDAGELPRRKHKTKWMISKLLQDSCHNGEVE